MLLAHIPAGYLLSTALLKRYAPLPARQAQGLLWLGLVCATLPDFDLLYFHFVDERRHNHHSYWTHIPIWWAMSLLPIYAWALWRRRRTVSVACAVVLCNVWLHCALDSLASGIQWFYPLSERYFALLPLPGDDHWWSKRFVLNFCALVELSIIVLALRRWRRNQTGASGA